MFTAEIIAGKLLEYLDVNAEGRLYFGFEYGDFLRWLEFKPSPEGIIVDGEWKITLWCFAYIWFNENFNSIKRIIRPAYHLSESSQSTIEEGRVAFYTVFRVSPSTL